MFVPSTGESALHILLESMTIDEPMLNLVLQYGASPYIPNKRGENRLLACYVCLCLLTLQT